MDRPLVLIPLYGVLAHKEWFAKMVAYVSTAAGLVAVTVTEAVEFGEALAVAEAFPAEPQTHMQLSPSLSPFP